MCCFCVCCGNAVGHLTPSCRLANHFFWHITQPPYEFSSCKDDKTFIKERRLLTVVISHHRYSSAAWMLLKCVRKVLMAPEGLRIYTEKIPPSLICDTHKLLNTSPHHPLWPLTSFLKKLCGCVQCFLTFTSPFTQGSLLTYKKKQELLCQRSACVFRFKAEYLSSSV